METPEATSVYLVFSNEDHILYPAQVTTDVEKAKATAEELVNAANAEFATVEEWELDGQWYTSIVVYVYPPNEPDIDELGAERIDIYG